MKVRRVDVRKFTRINMTVSRSRSTDEIFKAGNNSSKCSSSRKRLGIQGSVRLKVELEGYSSAKECSTQVMFAKMKDIRNENTEQSLLNLKSPSVQSCKSALGHGQVNSKE